MSDTATPPASDVTPEPAPVQAAAPPDPALDLRASTATEMKRIASIQKLCGTRHSEIAAKAVEEGWDQTRTELEVLRADRPQAPAAIIPDNSVTDDVLLAAACTAGSLPGVEQAFD